MANNIEKLMEEIGTPTLKAIANVFDLQPVRLYAVAKQPKEGQVYDAKVYNWDAIEKFIVRRLDPDKGPKTLEDVILSALEIDEQLKQSDGRRGANRGLGTNKKVEIDGVMVAARKYESFEMANGSPICLRDDANVYKIVYQTPSHTVLVPISNREGEIQDSSVRVIANSMLNMRGAGPASLEDAIQKRFSGEYAIALAATKDKKAEKAKSDEAESAEG